RPRRRPATGAGCRARGPDRPVPGTDSAARRRRRRPAGAAARTAWPRRGSRSSRRAGAPRPPMLAGVRAHGVADLLALLAGLGPRAVRAAEGAPGALHAVAEDLHAAVPADRRQAVPGAREGGAGGDD